MSHWAGRSKKDVEEFYSEFIVIQSTPLEHFSWNSLIEKVLRMTFRQKDPASDRTSRKSAGSRQPW
jgi:hypothetical protein